MPLIVKPGREYILGGKVHQPGETVSGVPQKFVAVLTSPKGPLMHGEQRGQDNPTDLPPRAKAMTPAPQSARPTRTGRYNRADMRATPVGEYQTTAMHAVGTDGQTGAAPSLPSSPPDLPPDEPDSAS